MQTIASIVVALLAAAFLAGCVEAPAPQAADADPTEASASPSEFVLPETIAGWQETSVVATAGGGNGLWIDSERGILVQSMGGSGYAIVDVSDAHEPVVLAESSDIYARDADMLTLEGRDLALLAGAGGGVHIVDITDAADPQFITSTHAPVGTHNLAAVPGTPYVYNSGANGIHVADLSDLDEPVWTDIPIPTSWDGVPVQTDGCHDITVRVDLGRAYCAGGGGKYMQGGGETWIWDISADPTQPQWIGMIDNPFIVYHHQAVASQDGNILMIDDEFIAPNCANVAVEGRQVFATPTAAVWFYDISDPQAPQLLSHIQPPTPVPPSPNCGSHFGDVVPDRDVLAMGFYGAGTILVDFSDASNPQILGVHPALGSTWDVRYYNGHFFTGSGDIQVLELV